MQHINQIFFASFPIVNIVYLLITHIYLIVPLINKMRVYLHKCSQILVFHMRGHKNIYSDVKRLNNFIIMVVCKYHMYQPKKKAAICLFTAGTKHTGPCVYKIPINGTKMLKTVYPSSSVYPSKCLHV